MRTIWTGVLDVFNLERGLIQSTITLTKRPGRAIREYLLEDRQRLMPPFRYLIFMVAIGTFVTVQYFKSNPSWIKDVGAGFEDGFDTTAERDQAKEAFLKTYLDNANYLFNNYFNLFILLSVPIAALVTRWFFRRRFNYAEHLVINSYVMGYLTVVYIALSPMLLFTDFTTLSGIYSIITIIYSIIVYQQVYKSPGMRGALASIATIVIYFTIYYILIMLLFIVLAFMALAQQNWAE